MTKLENCYKTQICRGHLHLCSLLFILSFSTVLSAQKITFLPKDTLIWKDSHLMVLSPPFQNHQNSINKIYSVYELDSLQFVPDSSVLYSGIRIRVENMGYFDFTNDDIRKDEFTIEYHTLVKEIEQKKVELSINKSLQNFANQHLKKYKTGLFRKKINREKLITAISSGEIFVLDSNQMQALFTITSPPDKNNLSHFFERLPISFQYTNRDLIPLYLDKAEMMDVSINSGNLNYLVHQSALIAVRKTPFSEVKSRSKELFVRSSGTNSSFDANFSYWYAFYLIKTLGLADSDQDSTTYGLSEIMEHLDKMEVDIYKKSFILFLESLSLNPLNSEFKYRDIDKKQLSLNEFIDKDWVLLDFWATWCRPCIKAFPELTAFYSENKHKFNLISLSVDDNFEDFSKWTRQNAEKYPWPFLSATQSHPILSNLKVKAYPSYYLINVKTEETLGPFHSVEDIKRLLTAM